MFLVFIVSLLSCARCLNLFFAVRLDGFCGILKLLLLACFFDLVLFGAVVVGGVTGQSWLRGPCLSLFCSVGLSGLTETSESQGRAVL